MNIKLTSLFRPIIYALFGLTLIVACQQINPLEGVQLTVNDEIPKSPVLIHFANANSTSANQPSDFTVKISGKDASLVKMDGGSTDFKTSHGLLPLALIQTSTPSASNPITFNIYAEIPGFAPVSQTITIKSDTTKVIDISAIELSNPASGTSVSVAQAALSNGVASTETSFKISPSSTVSETTTISIPAGTKMLDANGTAINANQLSSSMVYYSPTSPTSYGAFPGGFNPTNVVNEQGQPINGGNGINFVSAGLVSINMQASGTPVKKFSQPVKVSMEVNANTTNFESGQNVKEGDIVPLWSLNEETGAWKKEGSVTLTKNASGKLVANFETTHLSCFNLDWFFYGNIGTCNKPLTVTLRIGAGREGYYDVALVTPQNQYLAAAHWEYVTDGKKVVFPNVANIPNAKIVISDFNLWLNPRLPILAETPVFNPCTQGAIDITWQAPAPTESMNININIVGKCSNKDFKILPSGWYYIYDYTKALTGKDGWTYLYLVNGVIQYTYGSTISNTNGVYSIKLPVGHQYYVYTWNNNNWYASGLFTLGKNNFTLPAGTGITGSGVYNSTTNSLNITGTFSANCN